MTGNPRLGVFILFVFAAGNAFAQQSSGANVDSQQRISQPNRSVNAVDLDPEKSKDDVGARGMAPQSSSSWGIKRTEAQKTSLDGAKVPDKLSSWTLETKPVSTTTVNDSQSLNALRGFDGGQRTQKTAKNLNGKPATSRPAGHSGLQMAGGGAPEEVKSKLNPANKLAFDPMQGFAAHSGEFPGRYGRHLTHAQQDEYCQSAEISTEVRRLCAESAKRSSSHVAVKTTRRRRKSMLSSHLSGSKSGSSAPKF